jgi:hypothetical protein
MKRSLAVVLLFVGILIGLGVGFVLGWRQRQFDLALQENKVAAVNLKFNSANLCPQFREYLKARIYCNVYNYYPSNRGYLLQKDWDFGAVDRQVLGSIGVWKDPHQKVFDWDAATKEK